MISRLTVQHNPSIGSNNKTMQQVSLIKQDNSQDNIIMSHDPYSLSPTQADQLSESSLSNTDSDSLRSMQAQQMQPTIATATNGLGNGKIKNGNNNNNNNNNYHNNSNYNITRAASKSPILIKYNYYDYNGDRQEQANHDMNYSAAGSQQPVTGKVQRHLSPTFRQHLDEIVRNGQQLQQQQQHHLLQDNNKNPTSPPKSPISPISEHQQQLMIHFARRYKLSSYEQRCLRCNKTVYQMDKVGPLKDFTFYHQNCFKCRECGTKLTLKTYFNNQQYSADQEVYCHRHCPKTGPGRLDNQSVGIRAALNAPKVFEMANPTGHLMAHPSSAGHLAFLASSEAGGGGPMIQSAGHGGYQFNHQQFNHQQFNQQQQQSAARGELGHRLHHLEFNGNSSPNVDSRALYIQHAVQQTRLQNIYKQSSQQQQQQQQHNAAVDNKISQFISGRLEYLEPKQKLLEMRHREEEDALFKAFELKWRQEESSISEQIREEWQVELGKLLDKYKRQLSSISSPPATATATVAGHNPAVGGPARQVSASSSSSSAAAQNLQRSPVPQQMTTNLNVGMTTTTTTTTKAKQLDAKQQQQQASSKQQMIEFERMNLEKTMTIKLDRKKETLKRKLKEFERQATAELVEKQSREMLALISIKLDEYKEEQKRKIGYLDLEQFEAIDSLANQLSAGAKLVAAAAAPPSSITAAAIGPASSASQGSTNGPGAIASNALGAATPGEHDDGSSSPIQSRGLKLEIPAPKAPQVSKMELYNSEEADEVFRDIDQVAINVAREDQQSFTDLVHHLTRHCITDIEKVRAIFRWITVKNLNTMQFDSSVKPDTPLGLLRGIKNGSESYHVLFKRLCSYAGLHCVVIKGYSKSAGYQPGVKFEGNRFRNSWNAVYVAGAWRFVQCNWGARHLVSVAVMQDKNQPINGNHHHQHQHHHKQQATASNGSACQMDNQASGGAGKLKTLQQQPAAHAGLSSAAAATNAMGKSQQQQQQQQHRLASPSNYGRRGFAGPQSQSQSQLQPQAQLITMPTTNGSPYITAQFDSNAIDLAHHPYPRNCQGKSHAKLGQSRQTSSSPPSTSSSSSLSSPNLSAGYASNGSSSSPHYKSSSGGARVGTTTTAAAVATSLGPASSSGSPSSASDSLRYEYDDHYFLTDPDEFIYEFHPLSPEWQLIRTRPITLAEFEQVPFVRSLFFKYGLYFPQHDIRSVLYTDSSGASTIKIGMPTHMIPSLIFHYNLKYYDSDLEHYEGVSLKRFVMQSVGCGTNEGSSNGQALLSNIVSFRVHLPENGAYILDIFANSTTPTQYITGEPMKFKSVCKFKIIAKNLRTVMIPLPDCASGEFGPMKATRLFGIIPLTHESGLISVQNDKRFLEIQFRMTRPLLDFMASLHKNGYDERQLSKSIKILIDGDIVFVRIKFFEDGQYGLDIYTRDNSITTTATATATTTPLENEHHGNSNSNKQDVSLTADVRSKTSPKTGQPSNSTPGSSSSSEPKKQLLTHCCKYLINVRTSHNIK